MRRSTASAIALVAAVLLFAGACGSSGSSGAQDSNRNKDRGFKTLEATVVDREHEMPGTGGAGFAGTGNYYLALEARDGDATAHYRFQVTKGQYDRYPEGSHVRIVIADHELRDIRPIQ